MSTYQGVPGTGVELMGFVLSFGSGRFSGSSLLPSAALTSFPTLTSS